MSSSKKREEQRIDRALRALLKLPENRRCINCNNLGPQYVCTTFLTFVCTNCSGIHREFTHRVKSVSIATFTSEEVAALEAAGNGQARQIYFKEFDPERHSHPDSSNLHKLREFIRQVYLDRRYFGENQKLQHLKQSDNESYQPRKTNSYDERTKSPLYNDNFDPRYREKIIPAGRGEDRSFKNIFEERRSLSLSRDNSRSGSKKSTAVFEIVDNRVRDGKRRDGLKFTLGGSRPGSRVHRSCSPVVIRPVNLPQNQNTPSSGTTGGTADEKSKEHKTGGNAVNLIDFSMDPEPENAGSTEQTQEMQNNETSTSEKASQIPNVGSLEDLLYGLSVFPTAPASVTAPGGSTGCNEAREHAQQPEPQTVSLPLPDTEQRQPSAYPVAPQEISSVTPSYDQASPLPPNTEQQSKASSKPNQEAISGSVGASQPLPSEPKSTGRPELPMDLFANFPEPAPSWQVGHSHGIGFNSHYYPNPHAFPSSARSMNPFDVSDETPESKALQFPSMDPAGVSYTTTTAQLPNSFVSPRQQEVDGIGRESDPFASLMAKPTSSTNNYPAPNSTGLLPSKGGNPFE